VKQYPQPSQSRRRLLQAGATTPAILALAPLPVRADNCTAPSGFTVSGNLSRTGGAGCQSSGLAHTPGFWATNLEGGHYRGSEAIKPDTLFSSQFNGLGPYPDATFGALLASSNSADQALFAATFLEAAIHTGDGFPSRPMILDMWRGAIGVGYAVPNSTQVWSKPVILKYLKYLTGQSTV
jgi:hypothetical protein